MGYVKFKKRKIIIFALTSRVSETIRLKGTAPGKSMFCIKFYALSECRIKNFSKPVLMEILSNEDYTLYPPSSGNFNTVVKVRFPCTPK